MDFDRCSFLEKYRPRCRAGTIGKILTGGIVVPLRRPPIHSRGKVVKFSPSIHPAVPHRCSHDGSTVVGDPHHQVVAVMIGWHRHGQSHDGQHERKRNQKLLHFFLLFFFWRIPYINFRNLSEVIFKVPLPQQDLSYNSTIYSFCQVKGHSWGWPFTCESNNLVSFFWSTISKTRPKFI